MHFLMDMPRLFFQDCKVRLIKAMEFRLEFITGILTSLIFSCSMPIFQLLIYQNTKGYPGWSFGEIMLFQAVLLFWMGFTDTIFGDVKPLIEATVQYGQFDRFLVFPYPPLAIILTRGFNYRSIGTLLAGIISLGYGLFKLNIVLSFGQILLFLIFLTAGLMLYMAMLVFYCAVALRLVYITRLSAIIDKIVQLGNLPAEIFSGFTKTVFLSVLPLAIWINIPAGILLGRLEATSLVGLFPCILLFFLSLILWNINLKHYTSAGG